MKGQCIILNWRIPWNSVRNRPEIQGLAGPRINVNLRGKLSRISTNTKLDLPHRTVNNVNQSCLTVAKTLWERIINLSRSLKSTVNTLQVFQRVLCTICSDRCELLRSQQPLQSAETATWTSYYHSNTLVTLLFFVDSTPSTNIAVIWI